MGRFFYVGAGTIRRAVFRRRDVGRDVSLRTAPGGLPPCASFIAATAARIRSAV